MNRPVIAVIGAVVVMTTIVVATVLLAADAGIPSEMTVPVLIVAVFALRSAARRNTLA